MRCKPDFRAVHGQCGPYPRRMPTSSPSAWPSRYWITFSSMSRAWPASPETTAMPMVRTWCRSWVSTSAMATLNRRRAPSIKLLETMRLSLRDWAWGIWNWMVADNTAIFMGTPPWVGDRERRGAPQRRSGALWVWEHGAPFRFAPGRGGTLQNCYARLATRDV